MFSTARISLLGVQTITNELKEKMSFTDRLKSHPTVLMLRLLIGLEPFKGNHSGEKEKSVSKLMPHPLFILAALAVSLLLIAFIFTVSQNESDKNVSITLKEPPASAQEKSSKQSIATKSSLAPVIASNSVDKKDLSPGEISNTSVKANTVQINAKRIEKLELLLIQEQNKNKELYDKLNTQDVQLQELQALATNDIKVGMKDQKYIKALTESENTSVLDKSKVSKIDYYNKVRVLLKSEFKNQGSNVKQNSQLQALVNKLLSADDSSSADNDNEFKYKTSLAQESAVRRNEVRTIILKKNETLWGLAKRAYGKGMLYTKIIDANPHITMANVRLLKPGTNIRIP